MPLIALPIELIEQIACHLDLASLQSSRLVCASLRRQTLHSFRDRFFRIRELEWTKTDLDNLLEITTNEDFGDGLQNLVLNATPRHSNAIWLIRKRISEEDPRCQQEDIKILLAAEQKRADDTNTFFNESQHGQKVLTKVFRKLMHLHTLQFAYEPMENTYVKIRRKYCEANQHEMSRPFVAALAAIAVSNISITSIRLHPSYPYGAISIGRLESLAPALRNFDTAFASLSVLDLNLRDWRYPDAGFELDTHRAPFVVRFLAKARNVKELRLSCYSSLEGDLFGEMARHCCFDNLEVCDLSLFQVNRAADLKMFLAPSARSLRRLRLSRFILRDQSANWEEVLLGLADDPDMLVVLSKLELLDLFGRGGARETMEEYSSFAQCVELSRRRNGWREDLRWWVSGLVALGRGPAWHTWAVSYPFAPPPPGLLKIAQ